MIIKDFASRVDTLRAHGAADEEIEFLKGEDADIIEAHARRLIGQRLAREALAETRDQITRQAAATALPESIGVQLRRHLARHPSLAWDDALAQIIGGQHGRDVVV